MTDRPEAPLDEDVRALVESTRVPPIVPADSRARVLARVESAVFAPGGGGGGGGIDSGRHGEHGAVSWQAGWARRAFPLAASFILGAIVGAAAMRRAIPAHAASAAAPHDAPNAEITAPGSLATTTETPAPVTPAAAAGSSGSGPVQALEARGAPSPAPQTGLAAERALLDAARAALEREEGASALAATSEHERRFPDGILAQEREAMTVRALATLGRMDEAHARADRFHARFPGSALIPALESSIGSASKSK